MKRALAVAGGLIAVALLLWLLFDPRPVGEKKEVAPTANTADPAQESLQREPSRAPEKKPRTGTSTSASRAVFGVVRDPQGTPVAGATVRGVKTTGGEAMVTKSGGSGEYLLLSVPPILERLEVSATGFHTRTFDRPSFPGERRVRWDVVLEPALGVFGVVLCPDGPASGAAVALLQNDDLIAGVRADGDGRFALDTQNRPPPYKVVARHGGCGEGRADAQNKGAVKIDLPGGGYVEGTVTDRNGRAVPSFTVSASSLAGDPDGARAFDDERGWFRLGPIAPGEQNIWVVAPGFRPSGSERINIVAGETVGDLTFVLERSSRLRGKVTDAISGRPIEGAVVAPAEWGSDALADSVGGISGADGRYLLESLPARRTSIVAKANGYRQLMHGGVEAGAREEIVLDFALTPARDDDRAHSELTGIGAQLRRSEDGSVMVDGVLEGGPAKDVLRAGDAIVMVDDLITKRHDLGEIVQRIRGESGTDVVLWVRRHKTGEVERIVLQRARVSVPR